MRFFDTKPSFNLHRSERKTRRDAGRRPQRVISSVAAGVIGLSLVLTSVSGSSINPVNTSAASTATRPAAAVSLALENGDGQTVAAAVALENSTQRTSLQIAKTSGSEGNSAAPSPIPVQPSAPAGSETEPETMLHAETPAAAAAEVAEPVQQPASADEAAEADADAPEAQTEAVSEQAVPAMPAAEFSEHTTEDPEHPVTVLAEAPEGAFPAGTAMQVKTVDDGDILSKAENASGLKDGQAETDAANTTKLLKKQAVEITFTDAEGKEVEPCKPIRVSMSLAGLSDAEGDPQIVHIRDDGEAETVEQLPAEELPQKPADDEVVFQADGFSVYAIVYTVRFNYGEHEYILPGEETVMLSNLLTDLKIPGDDAGTILTADDIRDVSFTDTSLVSVTKKDGDWELRAEGPFATEETLTLTRRNGDEIAVKVTDDTAAELTPYITEVVVKKLNNGIWEPATTFNDGDTAQISIAYSIPDGIVTQDSPSVTYTLPEGVTVSEVETGTIKRPTDGKKIGTYTIGTDGKATLTFDKDRIGDGSGFNGDIQFESTVHNTSGEENKEISFGGSSSTITVHKQQESKFDISVSKTGSLSRDGKTMSYTITASTEKGTEGTVTIRDAVNPYESKNTSFAYNKDSIEVYKVAANGSKSPVSSSQYTLSTYGEGINSQFSIDNLPQLSAGEQYIVTYSAAVGMTDSSQPAKITNAAGAESGHNNQWSYYSKDMYPAVQKSGQYDANKDLINWTITLNQGKTADVSNWSVSDTTPDEIVGDVLIEDGNYQTIHRITNLSGAKKLDVKMAACLGTNDRYGTYYIKYATRAVRGASDGESFSKTNNVTAQDGGKTIGNASVMVTGKYREADVQKTFTSADVSDLINAKLHPRWKFDVQVPAGEMKSFTYTDTIGPVTDADGNVITGAQHYGTAAEIDKKLQGHLKLIVDDNLQYLYARENSTLREDTSAGEFNESSDVRLRVHYYAGGTEVQASDENTHIDRFVVEVVTLNNTSFTARKLTSDNEYFTTMDISGMKKGETWKVGNTGSAFNKDSKAGYSYTKPERFNKQVYQKNKDGKDVYESGNSTVKYDEMNGELKYRLMLTTTEADNGTITVTDTLPAGTSLVEGSLEAYFFKSEYDKHTSNYRGTDFLTNSKPSVTPRKNKDETTTLTITLPDYHYSADYPTVAITYRLSIADDPAWEDLARTQQTYENHAVWGGSTSSTKTTVEREREKVIKSGKQLTDEEGNYTNRVRYTIDINPGGLDLDVDSDTLTLTDALSGAEKLNPVLDISSLKLCNYDPDKEDHAGNELAKTSYTLDYDAGKSSITMKIPDSKALVLIYEYSLDESYGDGYPVSNAVNLNGKSESKTELKLHAQSSSSHAVRTKITVYKVDSRNNQIPLPGTKFRLEQYDASENAWKLKEETLTTDEQGKLEWTVSGSAPDLTADTLYSLIETEALPGYDLDSNPHYMIWKKSSDTDDTAYTAAAADKANVQKDNITFVSHTGGILYIRNTYTRVGVQKVWTNPDGSEAQIPDGVNVQVQLYRQNLVPNGHTVNITAKSTSSNNQKNLSVIVKDGTSLTIKFQDWEDNPNPLYVEYGGNKEKMILGDQAWYTYTFPSVTMDLNVTIQVKPYTPEQGLKDLTVEYTKAPNRVSNRVKVGDPVTLTPDSDTGKLSMVWDNLEQEDSAGNKYYYTVEETAVTQNGKNISGDYTTSYSNNDGIQSGQIIITNTQKEKPKEYVLPESGGPGARRYIGIGAMLIMTAGVLYIALQQKRRKGQL